MTTNTFSTKIKDPKRLFQTYKLALVYRPELVQIHAIFEGNEDMARSMEQIQQQSETYQWNG